jgi:membrane-associated phospholipid phosphatase
MRSCSLVIALLVLAAPARADHDKGRERTIRIVAIGAGIVLYASSETFFKGAISPDHCRWCEPPSLDVDVRDALVWERRARAAQLSNVTGYALAPLSAIGLLAAASSGTPARWSRLADDFIPVLEAVVATQLVTQLVKISVARQRPYARFPGEATVVSPEDNLSFFSGHSSLTFSIAVSAGMVAHRRGYRLEPAIWATGLALAASTAYLRIAADRHYLTDVLAGSAVGVALGYLLPRITGSLPARTAIVPTPSGVAFTGAF